MTNEFQFLIYNTQNDDVTVNAVIKDDTIWLTQKAMAELFGCSADNISLHLKNVYADGELKEISTIEEFSVVQKEGKREVRRKAKVYNLDAIISVGYRVNSKRATNFRIWATGVLKEYMSKRAELIAEFCPNGVEWKTPKKRLPRGLDFTNVKSVRREK